MITKIITIEGVALVVPASYVAPCSLVSEFPDCCGAGKGLGEKAVPETMYGLRVSAACHIHDYSWEVAEPTWADFHQTNSMFLRNILAIIRAKSRNGFMRGLRNYRAVTYFTAVDEVGVKGFWKLKGISPPQTLVV